MIWNYLYNMFKELNLSFKKTNRERFLIINKGESRCIYGRFKVKI